MGRTMRLRFRSVGCAAGLCAVIALAARADERVSFNRDIRPLLSDRCFGCHGPDEEARQADLRLDVTEDEQGPFAARDGYQVIKPGDLEASALWYRLSTVDELEAMPPKDSHKPPLTEAQKDLFRQWILQGAQYEDFWAFVPPQPQAAPEVSNVDWGAERIDQFVLKQLENKNLQPQSKADQRTLMRRVTLDLTGLPPSRAEIHRFLADPSPDAYRKVVDRLLSTPQYGEHMARYWLDLVRFADTNGIHHDHYREMTPYRDWVIRSFNENLPFDDFITFQIAGDLFEQPTVDQQIASGFNRLHLVIDVGTAIPQESYTRNVVDRVVAFGTTFLGMTLECAVCHDHKYDPVTQRDFYQLFAFFNNIDAQPETPGRNIHAPFIRLPTPEQSKRSEALAARISEITSDIERVKKRLSGLAANSDSESAESTDSGEELTARLKQLEDELSKLTGERDELEAAIPVSLVMKERSDARPAHILIRGRYDRPGEVVQRDTPAFLPPLESEASLKTRMDLARWVTRRQHPLTARVTVNRFWQQFFGVGLVKTSEDFGAQGEYPTHPELLDHLATAFVDSGWDVKALVRSIVLSETYQQSSSASLPAYRADPANRMLARGSRFRMDSEMIRDQILAVSGLLSASMYGKSVKPPQPADLWKSVSMVSSSTYSFQADAGEKIYRRSLYSFWKRAMPPPQMTIFDAPTRESCIARRERTNTPVQALVLMNESQYFEAAKRFAAQLLSSAATSDEERIRVAYESVTSRVPDADESASLLRGFEQLRAIYQQDVESAKTMTSDLPAVDDPQRVEIAAWAMLMNSLFNLDVAKTRQ